MAKTAKALKAENKKLAFKLFEELYKIHKGGIPYGKEKTNKET